MGDQVEVEVEVESSYVFVSNTDSHSNQLIAPPINADLDLDLINSDSTQSLIDNHNPTSMSLELKPQPHASQSYADMAMAVTDCDNAIPLELKPQPHASQSNEDIAMAVTDCDNAIPLELKPQPHASQSNEDIAMAVTDCDNATSVELKPQPHASQSNGDIAMAVTDCDNAISLELKPQPHASQSNGDVAMAVTDCDNAISLELKPQPHASQSNGDIAMAVTDCDNATSVELKPEPHASASQSNGDIAMAVADCDNAISVASQSNGDIAMAVTDCDNATSVELKPQSELETASPITQLHLPSEDSQSLCDDLLDSTQQQSAFSHISSTDDETSSNIILQVPQHGNDLPTHQPPHSDTGDSYEKNIDSPDSSHLETQICSAINNPETNFPAEDQLSNKTIEQHPNSQDTCSDPTHLGSDITTWVDQGVSLPDSGVVADDKIETIVADTFDQSSRDGDGISLKEGSLVDIEDVGREVNSIEVLDGDQKDQISSFPQDTPNVQNAEDEVVKKPFYFFIRIPRYDDENLREQIKLAEGQVQERTKTRDVIRARIQTERASSKECGDKVRAAVTEERAARDAFKSKRQDMDSVQSVINKLKNALTVEDIDGKIRNMEHMIEHETLPLKEEKQLIREIKQLKQQREQISSNMGNQNEVQKALEGKDQVEERLKGLRKELDILRVELSKAEKITQTAKQELNKENEKLNELVYQFKAADGIRQEAYAHLQSLKKQQYEKNKQFWRYRDDKKAAEKLALSGEKEQLQHFCVDQVGRIMELWNRDDDFRREYVRCNTRSTIRRLRTLDGRSLGPDEEPPIMPITVNIRGAKDNVVTLTSIPEQARENLPTKEEKLDCSSGAKAVEPKKQTDKKKKPTKLPASSGLGSNPATLFDGDEMQEEREEEEVRLSKEEEEVVRKAEEKRKEEEAAKLKQQLKLEEKAKAKEAIERKKRIAEKAQARAAIRAQKEAEEKEKEREKRARKKERKKENGKTNECVDEGLCGAEDATSVEVSSIPNEFADETAQVINNKEKAALVKRPQKSLKTKSIMPMPAPLRNRVSKRRMQMQSWIMWASPLLVLLFALIYLLANNQLLF